MPAYLKTWIFVFCWLLLTNRSVYATTLSISDALIGIHSGDNIAYLVLRFAPGGGGSVSGTQLLSYSDSGLVGTQALSNDVNNTQDGAPIFIATNAASTFFNLTADATLQMALPPTAGGAFCVTSPGKSSSNPDDCLIYGPSTSASNNTLNPNGGMPLGWIAQRFRTHPFTDGNNHTGDSFRLTTRAFVQNNSGQVGTVPNSTCGDGKVTGFEACDPQKSNNCANNCFIIPQTCGNGHLDAGEQCDDNNLIGQDGCSAFCQLEIAALRLNPVCGNHIVELNERCDPPGTSCNSSCTQVLGTASCGDGTIEAAAVPTLSNANNVFFEQCDPNDTTKPATLACTNNCTYVSSRPATTCGNGILEIGEECDDNNTNNNDGCSATCLIELTSSSALFNNTVPQTCGNGIIEPYEQCDLAGQNGSLGSNCTSLCTLVTAVATPSSSPNDTNDTNNTTPSGTGSTTAGGNTTGGSTTAGSASPVVLRRLLCQNADWGCLSSYIVPLWWYYRRRRSS